jgi:hypothetical protein
MSGALKSLTNTLQPERFQPQVDFGIEQPTRMNK